MKRNILSKILLIILMAVMVLPAMEMSSEPVQAATTYSSVVLDVPFYCQRRYADCGISSIAMVEAFVKGYSKNEAVVYNAVYEHNNRSVVISDPARLGYKKVTTNSLSDIYDQLKAGKPVIVYRKKTNGATHFSVIYGYNGSTTTLQKSGFLVLNTAKKNDSYEIGGPWTSSKTDFASWLSDATWQYSLFRTGDKVPLAKKSTINTLIITNATYPTYKKTNETFAVFGAIQSTDPILSADVFVRNSSGTRMFGGSMSNVNSSGGAKDSSLNYFHIHSVDSNMTFKSLAAGSYEYVIKAKDLKGRSLELVFPFTVGSSATVTKTLSRKEAEAHSCTWNSGSVTTAATCTKTGVKTYTCTTCGATKTATVAATGHSWNSGTVTTAATCTKTGVKTYTCSSCKTTKTETIAATGKHTAGAWTVSKAATCTQTGTEVQKCTVCSTTVNTRTVAATGHSWNSGSVTTAATCTKTGVKTYTCSSCKSTKTETIDATGQHTAGAWTVSKEATCTQSGTEVQKCTVCSTTVNTRTVAAMGHAWDQGVLIEAPTATEMGTLRYTCHCCGDTKTVDISAQGPQPSVTEPAQPSPTEPVVTEPVVPEDTAPELTEPMPTDPETPTAPANEEDDQVPETEAADDSQDQDEDEEPEDSGLDPNVILIAVVVGVVALAGVVIALIVTKKR